MPRRGKGGEVPAGPPGNKAACGARWPPQQLNDPRQRLVLSEDRARSRLPDPSEHVRRAGNEIEGHGGARRSRRDVGEIHRIVLRTRRRQQDVAKHAQRLGAPNPRPRDGPPGRRGKLRGRTRRRLRIGWPHDPLRRPLHRSPNQLGLVTPHLVNHVTHDASAVPLTRSSGQTCEHVCRRSFDLPGQPRIKGDPWRAPAPAACASLKRVRKDPPGVDAKLPSTRRTPRQRTKYARIGATAPRGAPSSCIHARRRVFHAPAARCCRCPLDVGQ
jgi:hypothetical protein